MEAKKVTQEQLAQLFAFTRKHFVEYYDLQAELADHLANAIEERWQEQPGLSFDEALRLEFKKFGIFGFSDIVERRQNALMKRYYRLAWREFRSALNLQMLVAVALAAFAIYKAVLIAPWTYDVFLLIFFGISSYKLLQLKKQYRKKLGQTRKKWLLEEIIYSCGGFGILMYFPVQLSQYVLPNSVSPPLSAIMAIALALLSVYDYVVLFRLPARAEMHLRKVYPEYSIENIV